MLLLELVRMMLECHRQRIAAVAVVVDYSDSASSPSCVQSQIVPMAAAAAVAVVQNLKMTTKSFVAAAVAAVAGQIRRHCRDADGVGGGCCCGCCWPKPPPNPDILSLHATTFLHGPRSLVGRRSPSIHSIHPYFYPPVVDGDVDGDCDSRSLGDLRMANGDSSTYTWQRCFGGRVTTRLRMLTRGKDLAGE